MMCKNSWKMEKMSNFRKNIFSWIFKNQDMIIWFDLGENTSLGSILKKISYSQNPYCQKAPSFCPHRRKKAFLKEFFSFQAKLSHASSTSLDQNFHMTRKPILYPTRPELWFFHILRSSGYIWNFRYPYI